MFNPDVAISSDLDEARDKIDAARKVLQDALDAQDGELAAIRQAIARLDRIEAELERVEDAITQNSIGQAMP